MPGERQDVKRPPSKPDDAGHAPTNPASGLTGVRAKALRALPQPMHLYEFLTRCGHYHFGCFQDGTDSLARAMNRTVLRIVPHLVPGGRVLDMGCGMGGTARLLAKEGFPVVGIDPDRGVVAYARLDPAGRGGPRYENKSFLKMVRPPPAPEERFENLVFLEVLQHLPDLGELFEGCRRLLRPGGVMAVSDVATVPALPWSRVPFHRIGAVCSAGEAAGWKTVCRELLTDRVIPTLDRLIRALGEARSSVLAFFAAHRPEVSREMDELVRQWEQLREGFHNGDLVYEFSVLRAPGER